MATIKAGTYRFKDVLALPVVDDDAMYGVQLSFTSSSYSPLISAGFTATCTKVSVSSTYLYYYVDITDVEAINTAYSLPDYVNVYDGTGWDLDYGDGIKTITIHNDTEVSAEFYDWFTENTLVPISGGYKFNWVVKPYDNIVEGETLLDCKFSAEPDKLVITQEFADAVNPSLIGLGLTALTPNTYTVKFNFDAISLNAVFVGGELYNFIVDYNAQHPHNPSSIEVTPYDQGVYEALAEFVSFKELYNYLAHQGGNWVDQPFVSIGLDWTIDSSEIYIDYDERFVTPLCREWILANATEETSINGKWRIKDDAAHSYADYLESTYGVDYSAPYYLEDEVGFTTIYNGVTTRCEKFRAGVDGSGEPFISYVTADGVMIIAYTQVNGWESESLKTLDFGDIYNHTYESVTNWFSTYADEVLDAKQISGARKFNEILYLPDHEIEQNVTFKTQGFIEAFEGYEDAKIWECSRIRITGGFMEYYVDSTAPDFGGRSHYEYAYTDPYDVLGIGWSEDSLRVVDFGTTPQTVSGEFYNWVIANSEPTIAGYPFPIELYKNKAEPNRVDKTNYITKIGTILGTMRDESSITDISITFERNSVPSFNYVYIPIFNRYYYVNDISSIRNNLWEMSLSVDALMTYKDAILNCKGFIDRNENTNNPLIIDKKRVVEEGVEVRTRVVLNQLFDGTGSYVLTGLLVSGK